MKDNRRDFIRKSASLAAVVSIGGLSGCTGSGDKGSNINSRLNNQDNSHKVIEWPVTFGPDKPKISMFSAPDRKYMRKIKQIGVDCVLLGGPQIPWTEKSLLEIFSLGYKYGLYPEHPRALDYDREHPEGIDYNNPGTAG